MKKTDKTLKDLLEENHAGYLYLDASYLQYIMTCGIPNHGEVPLYAKVCLQQDVKSCPKGWLTACTSQVSNKEIFIDFPFHELSVRFDVVQSLHDYKIIKQKSEPVLL